MPTVPRARSVSGSLTRPNARMFKKLAQPVKPVAMNAAARQNILKKIKLNSLNTAQASLKKVRISENQISPLLDDLQKKSSTQSRIFAMARIKNWRTKTSAFNETRTMLHWAKKGGKGHRRLMAKAFKDSKANLAFVHVVAMDPEIKQKEVQDFIADYFNQGGDLQSIIEWLRMAGNVLNKNAPTKAPGTEGGVVDTVGGWIEDAADAVGSAVTSLVDAVVKAGKTVGQAIASAVNWTVGQIKDLVAALVKAGKKVSQILSEAVKKSLSAFKKFIKALIQAGRAVSEIVSWAVNQTSTAIKNTIKGLLEAGKTVFSIMQGIASKAASAVKKIVKGLIQAGKSLATILNEVTKFARSTVKKFLDGLVAAGKSTFSILSNIASKAASIVKKIVQGLLDLGKSVAFLVTQAAKLASTYLKKILQGLFSLGKSVYSVLSSIVKSTAAVVKKVVAEVLKLGKTVASVIVEAARMTAAYTKKIVQAVLSLGKRLRDVLYSVAGKTAQFVKNIVQAVISLGKTVANILAEAITKGIALARKVAQALAALGKKIKDILFAVASKARTYIEAVIRGLIDAGKKLVQVMAEVLRKTGAVLKKMVQAVYNVFKKVGEILVTVAKRTVSIIRTVLEGLFAIGVQLANVVKDLFTKVPAAFRKGFLEGLKQLGRTALDVLKAAGSVIALAFAAFMELWGGHRPLTAAETAEARKIFGYSINLARVKIAVANIPSDVINYINGGRPFTTMYILNFASNATITMSTLIHELTHVWQAVQSGPVYMLEALHSQAFGRGYEVLESDLDAANGKITNLEREQQAVVVERYWEGKYDGQSIAFFNKIETLAKQVYKAKTARLFRLEVMARRAIPAIG